MIPSKEQVQQEVLEEKKKEEQKYLKAVQELKQLFETVVSRTLKESIRNPSLGYSVPCATDSFNLRIGPGKLRYESYPLGDMRKTYKGNESPLDVEFKLYGDFLEELSEDGEVFSWGIRRVEDFAFILVSYDKLTEVNIRLWNCYSAVSKTISGTTTTMIPVKDTLIKRIIKALRGNKEKTK